MLDVWQIETFAGQGGRDEFDSGESDLNEWLRRYASQSNKTGNTLVRVALHPDDGRIVGYYAQRTYQLDGTELKRAFPDSRKYPVPAVLIARLAVCRSVQGQKLGGILLAHALRACTRISTDVGVEVVVVHALHDRAREFYLHHGFTEFADHPLHLFIPMKVVRQLYPA